MRIALIFAVVLPAIAGCGGTLPPRPPMNAMDVVTPFNPGKGVLTTYDGPLTGRDWNCRGCY